MGLTEPVCSYYDRLKRIMFLKVFMPKMSPQKYKNTQHSSPINSDTIIFYKPRLVLSGL